MATEAKCIQLQIDADPRLAAAAGGAAHYLGAVAGLQDASLNQLQSAIVSACREELQNLDAAHPHLQVTLTHFADRIEVALAHQAVSSPAAAQLGGNSGCACTLEGIDQVQFEKHGGCAITRLTKFLHSPAPAS